MIWLTCTAPADVAVATYEMIINMSSMLLTLGPQFTTATTQPQRISIITHSHTCILLVHLLNHILPSTTNSALSLKAWHTSSVSSPRPQHTCRTYGLSHFQAWPICSKATHSLSQHLSIYPCLQFDSSHIFQIPFTHRCSRHTNDYHTDTCWVVFSFTQFH